MTTPEAFKRLLEEIGRKAKELKNAEQRTVRNATIGICSGLGILIAAGISSAAAGLVSVPTAAFAVGSSLFSLLGVIFWNGGVIMGNWLWRRHLRKLLRSSDLLDAASVIEYQYELDLLAIEQAKLPKSISEKKREAALSKRDARMTTLFEKHTLAAASGFQPPAEEMQPSKTLGPRTRTR